MIHLFFNADKLKLALSLESKAWKSSYGIILSTWIKGKLKHLVDYMSDKDKTLGRTIKDLEDVRIGMECLNSIRNDFISLDMDLIVIEETYNLLNKFKIEVVKSDQDAVDSLRYNFNNILQLVNFYFSIFNTIFFQSYIYFIIMLIKFTRQKKYSPQFVKCKNH